ncbi:DUF4411 family protein [Massilia sp. MB5]|uniref:DUF4411 family protein n=1 Tax=Massilia sp. MB5 TaxID=2919578 RepID=UPI001F0EE01A|nr:DUF4411 family protein [Massilia sp. MB5]UMR30456.1 DUF4411 family protein [Massilia sp. MB5]
MKYLLDSNAFIEAKNRYYRMTVCPAYWQWILRMFESNAVASISMVGSELKKGDDELAEWAKEHGAIFLPVDDVDTQQSFQKVAGFVARKGQEMKPGAVGDFLGGADPWLIAKAMALDAVVITHEAYASDVRKRFLIPNVCEEFGVSWMNTFDLLELLEARFVLPS